MSGEGEVKVVGSTCIGPSCLLPDWKRKKLCGYMTTAQGAFVQLTADPFRGSISPSPLDLARNNKRLRLSHRPLRCGTRK